MIGHPILKYYLALMYRRNLYYPMLGTEKGTATYRREVDSLPTLETVNRRQMSLLWNWPLRYSPDTMASYLWRSKDIQLSDIWPTSSVIKTPKREGPQDPNIHIIDGIHNIRERTYVNVFISNYTSKHITFNDGEHVGYVELPTEDCNRSQKILDHLQLTVLPQKWCPRK